MGFIRKSVSLLLLIIISSAKCIDDPAPQQENKFLEIIERQAEQLDRLEKLITRLQRISDSTDHQQPLVQEEIPQESDPQPPPPPRTKKIPENPPKGRVVARYRPSWGDHFQFLAAIRLDSPLSCLHILPLEGESGVSRHVAAGDKSGRLYIFGSHGDLLLEYPTLCTAPVTAIVSLTLRRNETLLITGHSNGAVLAHRLWETPQHSTMGSSSEDWTHGSLSIQYAHSFTAASNSLSTQVVSLEMYRAGRMRYLLVADSGGKIQVFRDNGSLYGIAESESKPLAFLRSSGTQRLLFLTSTGASSLDLRTMSVRSSKCLGLSSNSTFAAFTFETGGRTSRAYGVTTSGDLVQVSLSGDTLNFECHALAKRKLEQLQTPVKLNALRGYIVVATQGSVSVYNTSFSGSSSSKASVFRSVLAASLEEISQSFLPEGLAGSAEPLLVCDREKLAVVGFSEGYVGIFRSGLPGVQRLQELNGARVWIGPVLLSLGVIVFAWYFFSWRSETEKGGAKATATAAPSLHSAASAASTTGQYEKMSELVMKRGESSLLDDKRRLMSSPSRVYSPGGAASFGVGSVNYRSTVDGPYGL